MRKIFLLIHIVLLGILAGCVDRDFRGGEDDYGDGVADLRLTASFENLAPALESRAPGNAVHDIDPSKLWVVLYRQLPDGTFDYFDHRQASSLPGFNLSQSGNSAEPTYPANEPAGNYEGSVEGNTPRASFNMTDIPYGRYRIYAVANVSNLTREECETEAKLRSMNFEWKSDVAQNNAMFGYFTPATDQSAVGFQSQTPILISRRSVDLHCWVKRMVSKVTVAFDPSKLNDNVTVYVKKVTIRDIPKNCPLGEYNHPGENDLISVGGSIDYYTAATENDHEQWGIVLQRGSGKKGSVNHTNDDPALFFFENMQGDYEGEKDYLKEQIPEETGTPVDEPGVGNGADGTNDFKDRVRAGTWVEVEAYYHTPLSSGRIIYRFMLGKNITYNYDAERNYHYKLTLRLRGKANEADWHISYTEPTPTIFTPDSYDMSYLYGQYHGFPFRVKTGDENEDQYVVRAEIIVNGWYPSNTVNSSLPAQTIGAYNDLNGFAWNEVAYNTTYKDQNYAGFLSMRQPESGDLFPDLRYGEEADARLKGYYEDHKVGYGAYTLEEGERNVGDWDYSTNTYKENPNSSDGKYSVSRADDGSVTAIIPMYTRQKKLVTSSDFCGSNPYWAYVRSAKVRFTLWKKDGTPVPFRNVKNPEEMVDYRDVPIYQVRRIENPTAIYRRHDNDAKFDVTLLTLQSASDESYIPVYSTGGPWRASILTDPDGLVRLTGTGEEVTNETSNKYITGSTGSPISFTYHPRGTIGATQTRCAIILVEYNDYHCRHYIYVRQGYDAPVELAGTKWSCYQVYATGQNSTNQNPQDLTSVNVMTTKSPLSIGSMYKRCQYNYGIREENNETYGWLKQIQGYSPSVSYLNGSEAATKNFPWNSIGGYGWLNYNTDNTTKPEQGPTRIPSVTIDDRDKRFTKSWATTWTTVGLATNRQLTVPTYEQLIRLRDECEFAFGIAYADNASAPAMNRADAYGFTDYNNTGTGDGRGMRVCVAYEQTYGRNVLFPLGATGQGRRARTSTNVGTPVAGQTAQTAFSDPGAGSLTYSGIRSLLYGSANLHRPLTYNVYRSPGAVYWIKQPKLTSANWPDYASWDINYYTSTFNHYDYGSLGNWSQTDAESGAGVPAYTSTAIRNANGTITGYRYTWNNTSARDCTDALPIKLVYK